MEQELVEEKYTYPAYRPQQIRVEDEFDPNRRIATWMIPLLVGLALIVDLAELLGTYLGIVVVGFVIGIAATAMFQFIFDILKVDYTSNTKLFATSIITVVCEIIPGLDAFPFWFVWTLGMIFIIVFVRMEDRGQQPTILGALGRIATFATPIGFVTRYPIQRRNDNKFKNERLKLRQREYDEIAKNPENESFIRSKYSNLQEKLKYQQLGSVERLESKVIEIDKNGVGFRDGVNPAQIKQNIGDNLKSMKDINDGKALNLKNKASSDNFSPKTQQPPK